MLLCVYYYQLSLLFLTQATLRHGEILKLGMTADDLFLLDSRYIRIRYVTSLSFSLSLSRSPTAKDHDLNNSQASR